MKKHVCVDKHINLLNFKNRTLVMPLIHLVLKSNRSIIVRPRYRAFELYVIE